MNKIKLTDEDMIYLTRFLETEVDSYYDSNDIPDELRVLITNLGLNEKLGVSKEVSIY